MNQCIEVGTDELKLLKFYRQAKKESRGHQVIRVLVITIEGGFIQFCEATPYTETRWKTSGGRSATDS